LARAAGFAALSGALLLSGAFGGQGEAAARSYNWKITKTEWSPADEKGFSEFVEALGAADCWTVDECLRSPANPYRSTDPRGLRFRSDCADFPYVLRAYYAWKNGLPFSYAIGVNSTTGYFSDIRYTSNGNRVTARKTVPATAQGVPALPLIVEMRNAVSTAMYRHHADADDAQNFTDFYAPEITRESIRPGTVLYDVNGHVAMVWRVEDDGRILNISAHPDNSVSRSFYGRNFLRTKPELGTNFKNWRPQRLVGATRRADGTYVGGHIEAPLNSELKDFSLEQYLGTQTNPSGNWRNATFVHKGEELDYYHYIRSVMAKGDLTLNPVSEMQAMMRSLCYDIRARKDAVEQALMNNIHRMEAPARLPKNIYGTYGYWELYSTPSRDARLKTSFKEMRDQIEAMVKMYRQGVSTVSYEGNDLAGDLIAAFEAQSESCKTSYTRTNGKTVTLSVEDVMNRLFDLSFDPYQCVERRWGAQSAEELSSCPDGPAKQRWYQAQRFLRNQIDRTYDVSMDYTPAELEAGPHEVYTGRGVKSPPDVDMRAYLTRLKAEQLASGGTLAQEAPQVAVD
jgi:hypothetical protein